nr:GlyGly-CTERM sorting domain-containing protein [Alteromonas stellipolaris]
MSTNLDAELARFKTRVKEEKIAKVEHREGYSGGSLQFFCLLFMGVMLFRKMTLR